MTASYMLLVMRTWFIQLFCYLEIRILLIENVPKYSLYIEYPKCANDEFVGDGQFD